MVKTYSTAQEHNEWNKKHNCEFCQRNARYWSQNATKDGQRIGRVVWHCQAHRSNGRDLAGRE